MASEEGWMIEIVCKIAWKFRTRLDHIQFPVEISRSAKRKLGKYSISALSRLGIAKLSGTNWRATPD
jgi:hypothetical protein